MQIILLFNIFVTYILTEGPLCFQGHLTWCKYLCVSYFDEF